MHSALHPIPGFKRTSHLLFNADYLKLISKASPAAVEISFANCHSLLIHSLRACYCPCTKGIGRKRLPRIADHRDAAPVVRMG